MSTVIDLDQMEGNFDENDDILNDNNEEFYLSNDSVEENEKSHRARQSAAKNDTYDNYAGSTFSTKQFCQKYEHKVDLGAYSKKLEGDRVRERDKSDRATTEQVMDPRTRIILFRLLSRKLVSSIDGCVSTGKEANVYHGTSDAHGQCAIKVFKTSILIFKDRDRYISGEYRFRNGYARGNNRKMVQTWAEKEFRNLTRYHNVKLPSPKPILLKGHVLLMEFLGSDDGYPAPKLKDAKISESKLRELYFQIVRDMRNMYWEVKLTHADLSEYNILYHNEQAYYIDVSQAVENNHPNSLNFLRNDCTNITRFFRKRKLPVMTMRELFDFITSPTIDNPEKFLDSMCEKVAQRECQSDDSCDEDPLNPRPRLEKKNDEETFKQVYIPQTLNEVIDIEGDIDKLNMSDFLHGAEDDLYYKSVVGLDAKWSSSHSLSDCDSENSLSDLSDTEDNADSKKEKKTVDVPWMFIRKKEETVEERRDRKQAVKKLQRENRKDKKPKHVKKREEKVCKVRRQGRKC